MPSRSELPGEIKRRKFIKALTRVGFLIDVTGGAGSHYKAVWPRNQKSVTIPSELRKDVLQYVLKAIEEVSGVTWETIRAKL